jgi:lipid-binding SYLF domain-containing protein
MRLLRLSLAALVVLLAAARAHAETSAEVIEIFKKKDPGMEKVFADAAGYAVFPTVGKAAWGIGGAHGKGEVFEGGAQVGTSSLTQVTIGFQFGGQAYSEIIFFKDRTALDDFKRGNFELSAQASAIALTERAARDLAYNKGVAIVTMAKGGLMYEASVGGQKFSYKPIPKSSKGKESSKKDASAKDSSESK